MSADKPSKIATDLDYEREGKQHGHLRVPNSRDSSGWGTLLVPITVIKNGAGPTVLLIGGNHGDEYEGPVALMKLARALAPEEVAGRVIVLPGLNLPALLAGKRLSPIDGKNMNRVFPGERDGTITPMIADYVHRELVARADAVLDIHSGGYSMKFVPSIMMHFLEDKDLEARTLAALKAFGAPVGLLFEELDAAGMMDTAVEEAGKVFLSTELGGGGMLSPETVRIAEVGLSNVLKHFGVLAGEIVTAEAEGRAPTRMMESPDQSFVTMASASGIYEPFVELGEEVQAGAELGQIHFADEPEREPVVELARQSGLLICRRGPGHAAPGDVVAVLARDLDI